jgi:ipoprotein LpqH
VKRALLVAVGSAAIVVGGLAGCSSDKSASENASSATETAKTAVSSATSAVTSATDAAKGNPPPGSATLSIDGTAQNVEGTVVCTNMGGNVQIAVGNATGGLGAQLSDADPPEVKQVGLGNVNGVALGYTAGVPGGEASATKDGSTYKISGKAMGMDMANPTAMQTKSFEFAVTCP